MSEKQTNLEKAKKIAAAPKQPKEPFGVRVNRWFREMRSELKKVIWPTPQQLTKNTAIVVAAVVIVATVIAGIDLVFLWILDKFREIGA